MVEAADEGGVEDWAELVARARRRIEEERGRPEAAGGTPGPDSGFLERYDHLVGELAELLSTIPELQVESHGPSGLRLGFEPANREVRITPLEEQERVHFVFGHTTLGTLHRAEHHASRPFGEARPDVPRLARQLLSFLVEGTEPRWLSQRAPEPRESPEPPSDGTLELPLD